MRRNGKELNRNSPNHSANIEGVQLNEAKKLRSDGDDDFLSGPVNGSIGQVPEWAIYEQEWKWQIAEEMAKLTLPQ